MSKGGYSAVGGDTEPMVSMPVTAEASGGSPWPRRAMGVALALLGLAVGAWLGGGGGGAAASEGGGAAPTDEASEAHGYDHRLSYRLLLYSDAIYCRPRDVLRWNCPVCDALPAFAPLDLAGNVSEAVLALVGYDAALGAVVVSFRGTVLGGGIPDARGAEPTSWGFAPGRGTVRRSSVRRYDSMRAALHPLVARATATHPSAPVYLTGHSLGAGQALVAAADLPAAFPRATFSVFAFAPYRQSDEAWNAAVSAQPNLARIWRINHRVRRRHFLDLFARLRFCSLASLKGIRCSTTRCRPRTAAMPGPSSLLAERSGTRTMTTTCTTWGTRVARTRGFCKCSLKDASVASLRLLAKPQRRGCTATPSRLGSTIIQTTTGTSGTTCGAAARPSRSSSGTSPWGHSRPTGTGGRPRESER